jgi:hypothetical protein
MILLSIVAILLLLLILFVILFIFGFIHISLDAKYVNNKPDLMVKISLWKIRLAKVQLSDMKLNTFPLKFFFKGKVDTGIKDTANKTDLNKMDFKNLFQKWESMYSKIKKDDQLAGEILSLLRIHDIKWATTLGLEEAPLTAFAVGMAWTMKWLLIGRLLEWLKGMERPKVDIRPNYNEWTFQTHIKCMITFRLGKAILTAYRIAKIQKRRQVGKCQNIQYKA